MTVNYNELIKNWHTKASNEDYFSKFVFEYLAFIAYLKRKKYVNEDNDWKALRCLKNDDETKNVYLQKIASDQNIKSAWKIIKNCFRYRHMAV